MIATFLLLLLSLVVLYFGADFLVKGSSSLAARFGVSPLVIGLTIVAMGTSMPEFLVSLQAAIDGNGAISVGNIVGSNIFNIGVILGLSAIIVPLSVNRTILRFDMPVMLAATIAFMFLFLDGSFSRIEGIIFLAAAIIYTWVLIYKAKKETPEQQAANSQGINVVVYKHAYTDALFIIGGLAALIVGSKLLIVNATDIARFFGISEAVIGLTIVAAGTSMPELATSVVAAIKKNNDIAIGNIVGSNLYNLLFIMGLSATVTPIHAPEVNYIDLIVMSAFALALLPFMKSKFKLSRIEGGILLLGYVCYSVYLFYANGAVA